MYCSTSWDTRDLGMEMVAYSLSILTVMMSMVLFHLIPWILFSKRAIAVISLLLGSTFLGWVVALIII